METKPRAKVSPGPSVVLKRSGSALMDANRSGDCVLPRSGDLPA